MDYEAKACGKCNKLNFAYDDKFHYEKRLFCSNSSSRKCTTSTGAMHIFRLISISKSNTNNSISDTYEIANFEHWTLFVDAPENQRIAALFGNPHFSIELISYIEHIVHQDLSPKGLLSIPFAYQCYSYSYSISHFHRHQAPISIEIAFLCACLSKIEIRILLYESILIVQCGVQPTAILNSLNTIYQLNFINIRKKASAEQ